MIAEYAACHYTLLVLYKIILVNANDLHLVFTSTTTVRLSSAPTSPPNRYWPSYLRNSFHLQAFETEKYKYNESSHALVRYLRNQQYKYNRTGSTTVLQKCHMRFFFENTAVTYRTLKYVIPHSKLDPQ